MVKGLIVLTWIFHSSYCWFGEGPACPDLKVIDKLDVTQFMGPWYQYGSYGNIFIHGLDKCVYSNYSLAEDNITINMDNKRQIIKANTALNSVWKAKINNVTNPDGHLTVNLDIPIIGHETLSLLVLGVDYDKFAVIYVCGKVKFIKFRAGYIFMRKQTYGKEELSSILESVNPILAANNLSQGMFSVTQQTDCGHTTSIFQMAVNLLNHKPLSENNSGSENAEESGTGNVGETATAIN